MKQTLCALVLALGLGACSKERTNPATEARAGMVSLTTLNGDSHSLALLAQGDVSILGPWGSKNKLHFEEAGVAYVSTGDVVVFTDPEGMSYLGRLLDADAHAGTMTMNLTPQFTGTPQVFIADRATGMGNMPFGTYAVGFVLEGKKARFDQNMNGAYGDRVALIGRTPSSKEIVAITPQSLGTDNPYTPRSSLPSELQPPNMKR